MQQRAGSLCRSGEGKKQIQLGTKFGSLLEILINTDTMHSTMKKYKGLWAIKRRGLSILCLLQLLTLEGGFLSDTTPTSHHITSLIIPSQPAAPTKDFGVVNRWFHWIPSECLIQDRSALSRKQKQLTKSNWCLTGTNRKFAICNSKTTSTSWSIA